MVTRYYNGTIWHPHGFGSILYVDGDQVASERDYYEADEREEFDLNGGTLLPAFRDGHAHPLFAGRELLSAKISDCRTLEEIGESLKSYLAANPNLTWLDAGSYDRSLAGEKTRQFLDSYISEIPLVLHADDHHTIWVNSKALEVAGLLGTELPSLPTGSIDTDEQGLPTGILREFDAIELVTRHAPKPSAESDIQALLAADRALLASGIVSVQDAWVVQGMTEVYLSAEKELSLHYQLAFKLDPNSFPSDFEYYETLLPKLVGSKKLKAQAMKFFVDGVFGSATARVSTPYLTTATNGELNWDLDSLVTAINRTHQLGLQTHIHAIGDAGVEFALTALEKADKGTQLPVIAHAELTNPVLLDRAQALGISLCVQPFWAQYNGMLNSCIPHLGSDRTESLYAFRDMLDLGINLAFSSDWPVSNYAPIEGIAVAVNRRSSPEQKVHNSQQSISLIEAITAYTTSVQKMLGHRNVADFSVGTSFDAVLFDRDLKSEDLEGLMAAKVLAVFRNGYKLFPHH